MTKDWGLVAGERLAELDTWWTGHEPRQAMT
jgi:hypothetical protein